MLDNTPRRHYSHLDAATEDELRYIKNANRRNKKKAEQAPLLAYAGLIDYDTPAGRQEKIELITTDFRAARAKYETETRARIELYTEWLADLDIDAGIILASSWLARQNRLDDLAYVADYLSAAISARTGASKYEVFEYVSRHMETEA